MTGNRSERCGQALCGVLLLTAVLALAAAPSAAQDKPFAPSEADLTAWLKASAASLRTYAEPEKSLLDTQYLGLMRDGKPVGYEVFFTGVMHPGPKVYTFEDRAIMVAPDGSTVRVSSKGESEPSFNGIDSSLHLVVSGKHPSDLTVSAKRSGDIIEVKFSSDAKEKAPEGAVPQKLRVNTAGQVVALSGELQRLIRVRKWQTGDIVALWSLDAVNGNMEPVVLRALAGPDADRPIRVESWAPQDPAHPALTLQNTSFFNPAGALVSVLKPDGITKTVLTKPDFEKNWEPRFPK